MRTGLTVDQLVHDYGDVCQAITELAVDLDKTIAVDDFRTLNKCLDFAIRVRNLPGKGCIFVVELPVGVAATGGGTAPD